MMADRRTCRFRETALRNRPAAVYLTFIEYFHFIREKGTTVFLSTLKFNDDDDDNSDNNIHE